jgi:3-hydroxybutyryl-CoA dehydrogenase
MQTVQVDAINRIHIAGAGIMGASMAQIFARHGYKVAVYDAFEKGLEAGKKLMAINQETSVANGDITKAESEAICKKIEFTMDKSVFADAQFVIEAIVERMDIKHAFWAETSATAPKDAILTTNTSGLSITEMAKTVELPERFAGMHWINPPHIIPLVEVISGAKTDPAVSEKVVELAKRVGKKPITVKKDVSGFVLNRIQFCLLREAMHIVENGIADKEDVDNVLKYALGMRYACLGPFQVADIGGLDTFYNISSYLFADLCNAKEPQALLSDLHKEGSFGVKSGKGFYDYPGDRAQQVIKKRDADFLKLSNILFKEESNKK